MEIFLEKPNSPIGNDFDEKSAEQSAPNSPASLVNNTRFSRQNASFNNTTLPDSRSNNQQFRDKEIGKTPKHQTTIEFWRDNLQAYTYFSLPTDSPRVSERMASSGSLTLTLTPELNRRLEHVSLQNDTTLHTTVLTALIILLYRYSGETDIAIGINLSDHDDNLNNSDNSYCKEVVLRSDLSSERPGELSFLALLLRTRRKINEIYKHQHIRLEQLIEIAQLQLGLDRHPLFSILFRCNAGEGQESSVRSTSFSSQSPLPLSSHGVPATEIQFALCESSSGWQIVCEYNTTLFETHTVQRLLEQLKTLLQHAAVDPAVNISQLNMLNVADRRQLLDNSQSSDAIYPRHLTLPQLVESQVLRTPYALAVVDNKSSLSYEELDRASNRLAWLLTNRGVKPGDRIAILMPRTLDLVVTLLAVLKTGAAYIPLDPTYPTARLLQVFESAEPRAIISQKSFINLLAQPEAKTILVDSEAKLIAAQSSEALPVLAVPDNPAYIIYTSGSTGTPKGVVITHRAVVNFLYAMRQQPGISEQDTVLAVTTIAFDIAVLELYLPLICGAHLILANEHDIVDGSALLGLISDHGVTLLQATPVTWRLLLKSGLFKNSVAQKQTAELSEIGRVPLKMLCGGEALDRSLAEELLVGGGELWNMYGPTETTVWSSVLKIESGEGPVKIGPPIANTQFYILDQRGELLPNGVPGELYIGGDGVAQGYVALPEITAQKFIPDNFSSRADARLYRTGDRVRQLENGCLEYLGRTDNQIKLRGFRIELGEIETVLLTHRDIIEAVAVLGKDLHGEAAIFAYGVARPNSVLSESDLIDDLKNQVSKTLPAYMRPSAFILLDALPRTPNGKINRQALPVPELIMAQRQQQERAATTFISTPIPKPFTAIERRLAKLWQAVLAIETVDKNANFFDLGGHSLHAADLLTAIETEFGQRLSMLMLFERPSFAEQARLLSSNNRREFDFQQVVQLQTQGSKPPLIAIHNTGIFYYKLAKHLGDDQPVTSLQLFDPTFNRQTYPQTLEAIAAEYIKLIQSIHPNGPYQLIGWCVGGVLAFEIARQLQLAGYPVSLVAMIDTWAPGYRKRLPWLRAKLADYSFRWQLIGADWRRVLSREKTFLTFLAQRVIIRRLIGQGKAFLNTKQKRDAGQLTPIFVEVYDQWLLDYLDNAANEYIPKIYSGRLTILRSAQEPHGLFLDPKMGWNAFTKTGVDIAVIDGDHFTVFDGPGLQQIASVILSALASSSTSSSDQSSKSTSKYSDDKGITTKAYDYERKRQKNTGQVYPVAD